MKYNYIKLINYHIQYLYANTMTILNVLRYAVQSSNKRSNRKIILGNLSSSPRMPGLAQFILFLFGMGYKLNGDDVYILTCQGEGTCPQGVFRKGTLAKKPPCSRCKLGRKLLFLPFKKIYIAPNEHQSSTVPLYLKEEDFLPSLRHTFKKYNLENTAVEKIILNKFKASSKSLQINFEKIISQIQPSKVILFNGITFPEKTIREVCIRNKLEVFTYEVGFRDLSVFLTRGVAPSYNFAHKKILTDDELLIINKYLEQRTSGNFEMGLTKFWDNFEAPDALLEKCKNYKQVVTIFTNSVYDTSTVFSNMAFDNLFRFLDSLIPIIQTTPNTLFIFRAHPDEYKRVPYIKNRVLKTNETIETYLQKINALNSANVLFITPLNQISSYDLVKASKFVVAYNSTIGLEAVIMGKKLILGGNPKYGDLSFLNIHQTKNSFIHELEIELDKQEISKYSPHEILEAKAYLYQLVYEQSICFKSFLKKNKSNQVTLKFNQNDLLKMELP